MASKVEENFGFDLRRGAISDLTPNELDAYEAFETEALDLAVAQGLTISRHGIYVHLFSIVEKRKYKGIQGLNNRLSELSLKLKINPSQVADRSIKFLNGILGIHRPDAPPEVGAVYHSSEITYKIPGSYLVENPRYFDYVVTYVDGTPVPDRKVKLEVKGYPTSSYSGRIKSKNKPSKFDVELSTNIQLSLF
jgi:hypothetical protein